MKNHRHHFRQLFSHAALLALLFLVPASMADSWDGVSIAETNYQGLLAFKNALLDPGGYLRGWNGTGLDACSGAWEGIKCAQGQVIVIQLPWHGLGGTISDKLSQLNGLRKLNLHDNVLQGHIPSTIGLLPNLRGVYLFNNRLSGAIPPSIGNCPHLQTLDLSNNLISGTIPSSISSSSTSLYRLNLSHNKLVGTIPAVFTKLPSLTFLSLHSNNLSGSIPDTWGGGSNFTHLIQVLNLDDNSISGTIPTSLSTLPSLQELTLSNNNISGTIPKELGKLLMLQRLDLSNNSITGNIPDSLCNIPPLLHLNLEGNRLENKIPDAIDDLKNLTFLSLKRNQLEGLIPPTIGNFANLSTLDLSDNNLTGEIPNSLVKLTALSGFNVSNNNLSGAVPHILAEKFNSTSFRGNIQLCGYAPSVPCSSPTSSPSPSPEIAPVSASTKRPGTRKGLSVGRVVVLVALAFAALLVVLCCVLLVCCLVRKRKVLGKKSVPGVTTAAGRKSGSGGGPEAEAGGDAPAGKLVHFDGPLGFTADDLLCATAEIMGKTSYGTVYKASLEDGNQVAVKRLREKISKNQKEFEAEVATLGKIRHPNLLPLRAYYLGPKGEKLLVFDYLPKGTLATFLHARGPDAPIDWGTRMKIATGIGRGLLHLHTHENIMHGGMTSANVLLDEGLNPRISDYGLSRLMTSAAPTTSAVATAGSLGYRAPEMTKQKKATTKADVYSLGVVMLELLTGKSPGEAVNGLDLPQWVASIVEEDWKSEVFDLELSKDGGAATQDEMLSVLKLALHCVDPSPSSRPEVDHLLRQLEEIMPELKEEDEEEVGGGDGVAGMEHEGGGGA